MLLQVIKHVCFFCVVLQIHVHLDVVTKQVWVHERKTSKKRMKKGAHVPYHTPVPPGTTFMMCTAVYMCMLL